MPYLRLELSVGAADAVDLPAVLRRLVVALAECPTVDSKAVKASADVATCHAVGDGHPSEFARLIISILEGRTPEARAVIADTMFAELRAAFPPSVGLSQELREMNAADYRK